MAKLGKDVHNRWTQPPVMHILHRAHLPNHLLQTAILVDQKPDAARLAPCRGTGRKAPRKKDR